MSKCLAHIIFCFSVAFISYGQVLNAVLEQDEIEIGQPVRLTLSIIQDTRVDSVVYSPHQHSFYGKATDGSAVELEVLSDFKDTSYIQENKTIWKGSYILTCWDSTYVTLLPEEVEIGQQKHFFPAVLLGVTMPAADQAIPLYDIHELFTEATPTRSLIFWGWLIGGVLFLIIVWLIVKRSRKKAPSRSELSLLEFTLKQIDDLEQSKQYEQHLKEYYAALSVIMRSFLGKAYGLSMLDKTSNEIGLLLKKKKIAAVLLNMITEIMTKSDMVKFAKSQPPISEVFEITNHAREIVREISKKEEIE